MADDAEELELFGAVLCTVGLIINVLRNRQRRRKCRHKVWVSEIFQRRYQRGATHTLLSELAYDPNNGPSNSQYSFKAYLRMDKATYNSLFHLIEPKITGSSRFRRPVSAADKFNVTLRYLATGELLNYAEDG